MYCDICGINICKDCVEYYFFDVLIKYNVVLFKYRGFIIDYLICFEYKIK